MPPEARKSDALRAASIVVRSVHILAMALVVGGLAQGATGDSLRVGLLLTVSSGVVLLVVELARRCLVLGEGAGIAFFVKLGFLGAAWVSTAGRLEWTIAATVVASLASHMPGSWRHLGRRREAASEDE